MAINYNTALSPAANSLGLSDVLKSQDETEEMRRRRLLLEQMKQSVSPLVASGLGSGFEY